MEEKTYYDQITEFANEHAVAITVGITALSLLGCYKFSELTIERAMYKANVKTVDYILKKFMPV